MTPREDLLERIETYAEAKVSGSDRLIRLASLHLAQLLREVDIVAPIEAPPEVKAAAEAQLPAVRRKSTKKRAES